MSIVDHHAIDLPRISEAGVADYVALLKPRVMSLVVFTALVGLVIAPGHVHPVIAMTSILCIAVGGGAAGALNMWYEADIDALMSRTVNRPIPRGRILPGEALAFGLTLAFFSVMTLGVLVNWLAGGLLAFTIFFYAVVYTMWLKRYTAQNIVIGGCCRRAASRSGMGRSDRLALAGADHSLSDYFSLDAAALLGAGAVSHRRLCARECADAAECRRSRCNALANPALHHRAGCHGHRAMAARLFRCRVWPDLCGARCRHALALRSASIANERVSRPTTPPRALFKFSILYLFMLFGVLLLEVVVSAILRAWQ